MSGAARAAMRAAGAAAGLALLLGFATASSCWAQAVYRCGPQGRDYSQTPCKDGRAVDVDDARTPAQRAAAHEVARDDARRAETLASERRLREAAAVRGAAGITGPRPPQPAASSAAHKPPKRARAKAAAASAARP